MILYFLRHAEAESYAASDFERQLTAKGIEQATKVGKFCLRQGLEPDVILTSPVIRAKRTAEIVGKAMDLEPTIEDWLANGVAHRTLLRRLASHKGCKALMLVGHEPDFSACISALLGLPNSSAVRVQKASLTAVDALGLEEGDGQLVFSIPVRLM
ncbi:MAG: phosphohistidine phosphatase SixA [Deltaproteobacteria bacterium]